MKAEGRYVLMKLEFKLLTIVDRHRISQFCKPGSCELYEGLLICQCGTTGQPHDYHPATANATGKIRNIGGRMGCDLRLNATTQMASPPCTQCLTRGLISLARSTKPARTHPLRMERASYLPGAKTTSTSATLALPGHRAFLI